MNFGHPLLLLTLLVIPVAIAAQRVIARRRVRYAVRYTNVDVLASVAAAGRPWRRWLAAAVFLFALGVLCVAVSRPHMHRLVASDNATIVLVLDVSGSMNAQDVKPTRLIAAEKALHTFIGKVPARFKVGLILFAGEAEVAAPPTTDHALVDEAVDNAAYFNGFGGTAIGDAIATAVQVGLHSAGITGTSSSALAQSNELASYVTAARKPSSTLVSILFLSDGHQTRGSLTPLAGANKAKAAGIPVYTVALGTTGQTSMRGFPGGFPGNPQGGNGGFSYGFGLRGLAPDPKTLRAIAVRTGGKFYRAKTAGTVQSVYSSLGSRIGRKPGNVEITDWFLIAGAGLLLLGGVLSALWSPKLP
ncbi:MAG TPA: VWA domain-containing protein [Gaiellaceae bacterium]|nr:VWA domain-containing protein [Gaiellaceae bacterium]